eukprot:TRINITY_DN7338_c0_g2_i1.p1 TRINITY_DN7338_c0_g2~~TRINITY_DN7338_c0_g2_i1.p1  ORF type:complete len:205 (-),score=8.20 TRINITY_DN7338_c0_g2_i1:109-723(-)
MTPCVAGLLLLVGCVAAGGEYKVSDFVVRLRTRAPDESGSQCDLLVHESLTFSFATGTFSSAYRAILQNAFVVNQSSIVVTYNGAAIQTSLSVTNLVLSIRWTYPLIVAPATAQFEIYYTAMGALSTHPSQKAAALTNNMFLNWESVGTEWTVYLTNVTVLFNASTYGIPQNPQTLPANAGKCAVMHWHRRNAYCAIPLNSRAG